MNLCDAVMLSKTLRTRVAIVGAGPAGLLLARLLQLKGIDTVVVEKHSEEHVLGRIRAGVLEETTVGVLREAQVDGRLKLRGIVHDSCAIAFQGEIVDVPLRHFTGKGVTIYGQTEVTRDLLTAYRDACGSIHYNAKDVEISAIDTTNPQVSCVVDNQSINVSCEIVAGCDGSHGVSRECLPANSYQIAQRTYPFAWLGLLANTPPVSNQVLYNHHQRGFALCSLRSRQMSRYYLQCAVDEDVGQWSDDKFWQELRRRLPDDMGERLEQGPAIEKSVTPLRSFVVERLRFGRLFLAGDAAHVVPPTGAKGLNLAVSDVYYLAQSLAAFFTENDKAALDAYAPKALNRVWQAERFSWWFTMITHQLQQDRFAQRMQQAELEYMLASEAGLTMIAENYVGLPL